MAQKASGSVFSGILNLEYEVQPLARRILAIPVDATANAISLLLRT